MSSNSTQYAVTTGEVPRASETRTGFWLPHIASLGRLLSRDMIATVATSFVLFGMLTVQGIFLARMLGPEGRGQYATAVFYTQTLMYVGMVGTQHAIARWAARRRNERASLVDTAARLGTITGIVTMAVVTALAYFALPADKRSIAPLCVLCACFLPLEHVRLLWLGVDHGRGDFQRYNRCRLAGGLAFPTMLGVAWACGTHSVFIAALLFAAAPLLGLFYQRVTQSAARPQTSATRGPTVQRLLQRGRPYALAVLVADLCDRLDIFLFLWLATYTAQGYYAAAVPSANLLLVVPIALALFAFNAGARREQRPTRSRIVKASAAMLGVQIVATICYALLLEPLMVLVFGEDFRGAVPLTLALLPAYGIAGCGRVAEAFLQGRNKAILGVYSRLSGAATMGVFIYLTFNRWAEMSIPLGAVAGYMVSTSMLWTAIMLDARSQDSEIAEGTL